MTVVIPTLHKNGNVEQVLAEILRVGRPRLGVTLVAVIDLTSWSVRRVVRLETPPPLPDDACDVPGELSCLMSPTLCSLALEAVPERDQCEGSAWLAPDHELITVVCRDGDLVPSETEQQFFWGWRFSNHCTRALHGDVYVVTPQGWAGLLGGKGEWPRLTAASPDAEEDLVRFPELVERQRLLNDPTVRDAAALLAATALQEMVPEPGECLLCYEVRLLDRLGCNRTLRIAQRFREVAAPRATRLERRLRRIGVTCDCQMLEVYGIQHLVVVMQEAARELGQDLSRPAELGGGPPCCGVRRGSTQPCATWGLMWRD